MIKAVVFDFDGLILDSETSVYNAIQEIFTEHSCNMPLELWQQCIGTKDFLDPFEYLEEQINKKVDRKGLRAKHHERVLSMLEGEKPLPGVEDYLEAAKELGLKIALATSSSRQWVTGHLEKLNLLSYFDCLKTADDVEHVKPDPALYLEAVKCLGVKPNEAIAFEDSANGARAAKAAGLYCVVIPNEVTKGLVFGDVDHQMESLAEVQLKELMNRF
ncbi:HAD family hydrolase [Fictibacillus sp. KIGAM418]|uniref:HAD family hydrolase n=1 Tax=Fictibacillus marinisediminis TaxID=2878389 RepID=A0A9X1X7Y8_9BACL|nr:HAD family hydrolase [Fictibacillus marinisediminis]MCK6255787.1 HAD family hydrolase [Fictibacillus marinisediminis]SFE25365.1 haloacid dehalogenase superfamily, subfamily IA, variant 3 with third motif having DD or ED [Bacillus sp. OV194]